MKKNTIRAMKIYFALTVAMLLAFSGITLIYKIVVGDDALTGLPTWLNFVITACLLALSVTMTRSIPDEPDQHI